MKKNIFLLGCLVIVLFLAIPAATQGMTNEEAKMQELGVIERTIEYNGVDIYYYTLGDALKSTIVFLHPAFTDHHIFVEQLAFFADDYYIVMVDMIGHGKSQQKKPVVNMGDMPDVVNMICVEQRIKSAHLVGVSLGSLVVQGVADVYPALAKSVTVVGGYSIHKDNEPMQKAQNKEIVKWLFNLVFNTNKLRDSVTAQSVYTEYGRSVFRNGAETYKSKSFFAMNGMNQLFVDKETPVAYPLLLICGEHDLDLAKDAGKRLAEIEPNGTYVEIKDAGHCANIDNPDVFNQTLKAFFETLD